MQYPELIQLYFERSNSLQSLWTLYVVVIGGVLAFASLRLRPDPLTTSLVTVLFLCFAYRNIGAIHDVTIQRFAVLDAIHRIPVPAGAADVAIAGLLNPTLQPPVYSDARNFHVAADGLTILALWAMERRRRRHALTDARPATGPGVP